MSSIMRLGHFCAEAGFGVGAPVFAIKADEDRGVGNCHVGFEDQDVELIARLGDLGDDLVVGQGGYGEVAEHIRNVVAVGGDAGGIVFRNEAQFRVQGDDGADVDRTVDGAKNFVDYLGLVGVGFDGFDAQRGLEGIGGIDDENPVAMAEQGHGLFNAVSPDRGGDGSGLGVNDRGVEGQ